MRSARGMIAALAVTVATSLSVGLAATMPAAASPTAPDTAVVTGGPRATSAQQGPARDSVNVHWVQQKESYWCGPATAPMVLSARMGANTPSQAELSGIAENDGGTYRTEMRDTLNSRLGTSWYEIKTDKSGFYNDVKYDVSRGYVLAVGILIKPGGPRPPGYPSTDLDHWVAVAGYDSVASNILVYDPVAGRPGFGDVPKAYWVPVSEFTKYLKVYVA